MHQMMDGHRQSKLAADETEQKEFLQSIKGRNNVDYAITMINYAFSSPLGTLLVVQAWLCSSMVIYKTLNNNMDWADSYYFAAQAGLSIGFGSLSETSSISRLFSGFQVIIGGLVVGDALNVLRQNLAELISLSSLPPRPMQGASSRNV